MASLEEAYKLLSESSNKQNNERKVEVKNIVKRSIQKSDVKVSRYDPWPHLTTDICDHCGYYRCNHPNIDRGEGKLPSSYYQDIHLQCYNFEKEKDD